jgi:hypothetical protein
MSFQLVEMALCHFIDSVLDPYWSQLAKFWPYEKIDFTKRHQQELFNAYNMEPGSKLLIDKQDHITFFNTGWDDLKGHFEHLRMLCYGLANAFINTTSVESNFSILKWEKMTFDSQWWTWCWRASFGPSNAVLWWEFLLQLGSMMALGPNRTSNWDFYNLRHKIY